MLEQFRQMVLAELEAVARQAADAVLNQHFYATTTNPNTGQVIPGSTVEGIGAQTIALNARGRAIWDAAALVNKVYKTLTTPKADGGEAKEPAAQSEQKVPYA